MKCLYCGGKSEILVSLHPDGTYITSSKSPRGLESIIHAALIGYWRWMAEGQLPYQHSYKKDVVVQYYYDTYHDNISYVGDGIYSFDIQLSDSPEGDEWVVGKFRIVGYAIEVLEQVNRLR